MRLLNHLTFDCANFPLSEFMTPTLNKILIVNLQRTPYCFREIEFFFQKNSFRPLPLMESEIWNVNSYLGETEWSRTLLLIDQYETKKWQSCRQLSLSVRKYLNPYRQQNYKCHWKDVSHRICNVRCYEALICNHRCGFLLSQVITSKNLYSRFWFCPVEELLKYIWNWLLWFSF